MNEQRALAGLPSLVRLRFGAVCAQLVVLLVATLGLEVALPIGLVLMLIGGSLSTNILLARVLAVGRLPLPPALGGIVLSFDTLVLTALLAVSGGPSNPFSMLYLVHVALAAVMLGTGWTWMMTGLSALGYGLLFLSGGGAAHPMGHVGHTGGVFSAHLQGMWVAFTIAAGLIAYFVSRLSEALRLREQEISRLRELAENNQRLASLTTLAAGAAHELSTPLATVAVVAKEIQVKAEELESALGEELREDARLIRSELDRCRVILEQMSADSGETVGETPDVLTLEALEKLLVENLPKGAGARITIRPHERFELIVPRRALVRVLGNLIKNGLDASGESDGVVLEIRREGARAIFVVEDHGSGMAPETTERALEPFFTTKAQGKGLGLGLFLAKTFADRLGGELRLSSKLGRGTLATLELPGVARTAIGAESELAGERGFRTEFIRT